MPAKAAVLVTSGVAEYVNAEEIVAAMAAG
jgi:hypothetical protein